MTYKEFILAGKARLQDARLECADPLLHMKQLVQAALEIDAAELVRRWDAPLEALASERIETMLRRRLTGEPFQYIVGHEWFWDLKFAVGPGVLIPRPETEQLVEWAMRNIPQEPIRVAELGAGSGIIGITLLQQRPWEWWAWESNPQSVPFLKRNLALLNDASRYHLQEGDYFQGVRRQAPYDWVISNPPYVRTAEWSNLSSEVRSEPRQALDGGASGLEIIRELVANSVEVLKPGGGILLEIGDDQGPEVLAVLKQQGFVSCAISPDLAGRDRVASARRNP